MKLRPLEFFSRIAPSENRNKGIVGRLQASIRGMGDIHFGGEADYADLSILGMGNIYVKKVNHRPCIRIRGMGKINVGNW